MPSTTKLGKLVGDNLYVHTELLPDVAAEARELVNSALSILGQEATRANVVKIHLSEKRVSLLEYPTFFEDPFPALRSSWLVDVTTGNVTYRTYEQSANPPILHRKELLLPASHPAVTKAQALTAFAEQLGLFDRPHLIGNKQSWANAIAAAGYECTDTGFMPLGNAKDQEDSSDTENVAIERHRTALRRRSLSAPIQSLIRNDLLPSGVDLFDYGCGHGDDIATLTELGFEAAGWDPYFRPDGELKKATVINLGFVLNVIEKPAERATALRAAFELCKGVLAVSVMLPHDASRGAAQHGDGVLTSIRTFQKYFTQSELYEYVKATLGVAPIMAAPGIAYVFADEALQDQYLTRRVRNNHAARLILSRRGMRSERPPSSSRRQSLRLEHKDLLLAIWNECINRGRAPEECESPLASEARNKLGSWKKALSLVQQEYDHTELKYAAEARKSDLSVLFALSHFTRNRPFGQHDLSLRADTKAFFGTHAAALDAGRLLLSTIADRDAIQDACSQAAERGLGFYIEGVSLQIHTSLVEQLPAILRTFVACAAELYGDIRQADLVKIHIRSSKLSVMKYHNFVDTPIPLLKERAKINLRTQDVELFRSNENFPPTPLYFKSRYINADCIGLRYEQQAEFDRSLEALNLFDPLTFGPSLPELRAQLRTARKAIAGFELAGARSLPDIDDPCGKYLTYRDLIECGHTQKSLGVANIPKQADTYNALTGLARNVLDPIIDYFGMITLTYGFCSANLQRSIKANTAPAIDQHASHEVNARGNRICGRNGSACDFLIQDENMRDAAEWIMANINFDRMYFYGVDRPLHISWSDNPQRLAWEMRPSKSGRRIPRPLQPSSSARK